MSFKALVGNNALVLRLANMSRAKQVPPSLIFTGPAGVGKLQTAIKLAQAQNCTQLTGDACGHCSTCERIARNTHPDIHLIKPEGPSQQLKAETIRHIVNETKVRPFEGRQSVFIIVDAERMNVTASNALLKSLEEPPEWVLLILITANNSALLPTVLSRCQTYRFAPLTVEDLSKILTTEHGFDSKRAALISTLSEGSLDTALAFKDESLLDLRKDALNIANIVSNPFQEKDLVPWADNLSKNSDLLLLLRLLLGIFRDIAATVAGGPVFHYDLVDNLQRLSSTKSQIVWISAYQLVEQTFEDIRDRHLNKRITMSRLLSELNKLSHITPVGN